MKQYVFDESELREVCEVAWAHGYVHGTAYEAPITEEGVETLKFVRAEARYHMDFGKVLTGEDPQLWFSPEKAKSFYDKCPEPITVVTRLVPFVLGFLLATFIYWRMSIG